MSLAAAACIGKEQQGRDSCARLQGRLPPSHHGLTCLHDPCARTLFDQFVRPCFYVARITTIRWFSLLQRLVCFFLEVDGVGMCVRTYAVCVCVCVHMYLRTYVRRHLLRTYLRTHSPRYSTPLQNIYSVHPTSTHKHGRTYVRRPSFFVVIECV